MRLLISVANAAEASDALAGGADIIDAKEPLAGALGAVSVKVLREIHAAVAGARPVTAALGDASDEATVERAAAAFTAAGAALDRESTVGSRDSPERQFIILILSHQKDLCLVDWLAVRSGHDSPNERRGRSAKRQDKQCHSHNHGDGPEEGVDRDSPSDDLHRNRARRCWPLVWRVVRADRRKPE
jgi:hypothetical protein